MQEEENKFAFYNLKFSMELCDKEEENGFQRD